MAANTPNQAIVPSAPLHYDNTHTIRIQHNKIGDGTRASAADITPAQPAAAAAALNVPNDTPPVQAHQAAAAAASTDPDDILPNALAQLDLNHRHVLRRPMPPANHEAPIRRVDRHPLQAPLTVWVDQAPELLRPQPAPLPYWETNSGSITLQKALWGILRVATRHTENDHRVALGQRPLPKSTPIWAELSTIRAQFVFDNHTPPTEAHCLDEICNSHENGIPRFLHYWRRLDSGITEHWAAANPAIP